MKKKNNTEPLLLLPHELDRWPLKYTSIPDKRIMVYLLNLVRVSKYTARERLNKKIGTSRYNLLIQTTQSILERIGEDPAKIKAEVWYQSIDQIKTELIKKLEPAKSEYNLYDLIKELTVKIPKDYIKLEEPGKVKSQKKLLKPTKPVEQPVKQKTPAVVIKKKLKLPPKIIIVE